MRFPDNNFTASRNGKLYGAIKRAVSRIPEPSMYKLQVRVEREFGIHLSRRLLALKLTRAINEQVKSPEVYQCRLNTINESLVGDIIAETFIWYKTSEDIEFWSTVGRNAF